jgi:branched-chain amino acid transport system substrate-binding protein
MKTKRAVITLAVAATIIVGVLLAMYLKNGPDPNAVVIGAALPLTGDAATFGLNASRGAQLAVEHANAQDLGKGIRFAFRVEDSRGDATQAVTASQKLIDSDGAKMLIGDVTSAGTHALIPIAERAGIPLISPSASDPSLTGKSQLFSRVWPSDDYEAHVIGQYAVDHGYSHIAVVYANTDYGVAMVDEMTAALGRNRISLRTPIEREATSLRPVVERVKQSNSDAVFMVLYPEDAKRFMQQLTELQVRLPVLATATFEDSALADIENADRVVFASPRPPSEDSSARKLFQEQYHARFGEDPGVLSDTGYDAAMILIQGYVSSTDHSATAVMDHIRALKEYPGVSGSLTFDRNGDVKKPYGLKTVKNGKFTWLE